MSVAVRSVETLNKMSHLPPSFDGNPFLYAAALTSVMSIACLGVVVTGWMARDTWRDRYLVHPTALLFMFRAMMGLIGFVAFLRSLPEVLYLQVYGDPDVPAHVQAAITTAKRAADTTALWFVALWVLLLVAIYPPLCVALKTGPARYVAVDPVATWPRLMRPMLGFLCIIAVAIAFAYGKVYGR
jgi:hypothetical protein